LLSLFIFHFLNFYYIYTKESVGGGVWLWLLRWVLWLAVGLVLCLVGLGEVSWFRGLRPWRYGDAAIML
jgi:hypothetical protein